MGDRIPISTAQAIGKKHSYDQVIIIGRRVGDDGQEWFTTWGRNREHCDAAVKIRDAILRRNIT